MNIRDVEIGMKVIIHLGTKGDILYGKISKINEKAGTIEIEEIENYDIAGITVQADESPITIGICLSEPGLSTYLPKEIAKIMGIEKYK